MRLGVIGSERWPLTRLDEITNRLRVHACFDPNLHIVTGYLHHVDHAAEAFAKREGYTVTLVPDKHRTSMFDLIDELLVFVLGDNESRDDIFLAVNQLRTYGQTTPIHFVYSEKKPNTAARLVRTRKRRR